MKNELLKAQKGKQKIYRTIFLITTVLNIALVIVLVQVSLTAANTDAKIGELQLEENIENVFNANNSLQQSKVSVAEQSSSPLLITVIKNDTSDPEKPTISYVVQNTSDKSFN